MRIFKSREIISQTRRKYQKLPEIRQRQQMERDMKIRRNHRILVNVFSKVRFTTTLLLYVVLAVDEHMKININLVLFLKHFFQLTKSIAESPEARTKW